MAHAAKALFTLEEAVRALPLVRSIVTDLVSDFRALRTAGRERRALEAEGLGSRGEKRAETLAQVVTDCSGRVEEFLKELAALGLEVRDLELNVNRRFKELQEDLNLRRNEEVGKMQRALLQEVQAYARANGYQLIVSDGVLYAADGIDITPELVAAIKAKAPAAPAATPKP